MPSRSPSKLTPREKRAAKRVAQDVVSSPAPLWPEVGEDEKSDIFRRMTERLRATKNSGIAKAMEWNNDLAWSTLQEKCKSMRAEERRLAKKSE